MVVGLFLLLALCVRGWSQEGWSGSWTTSNDLVPTLSATEIARPRPAKATVVTTYASSAMTSTNCIMAYARYAAGMIDFDVADLKSTNSSAQGFRVVCEATAASGSAMPISAMVLREPSAYVPVDKGFKSQSTLHSS